MWHDGEDGYKPFCVLTLFAMPYSDVEVARFFLHALVVGPQDVADLEGVAVHGHHLWLEASDVVEAVLHKVVNSVDVLFAYVDGFEDQVLGALFVGVVALDVDGEAVGDVVRGDALEVVFLKGMLDDGVFVGDRRDGVVGREVWRKGFFGGGGGAPWPKVGKGCEGQENGA